jgi:hypothetical protein
MISARGNIAKYSSKKVGIRSIFGFTTPLKLSACVHLPKLSDGIHRPIALHVSRVWSQFSRMSGRFLSSTLNDLGAKSVDDNHEMKSQLVSQL